MSKILLKIIAQDHLVSEIEVDKISLQTVNGQITILPNHIPLVAELKSGEAIIFNNDQQELMSIAGGFVEVGNNRVLVLADRVERAEEIDLDRAQEAYERAQQRILELKDKDNVEYVNWTAQLEKELSRLKIARKHRRSHSHGSDTPIIH